jgi:hypothetical protein
VALTQDETVTIRIGRVQRIDIQYPEEQGGKDIRAGEITARMSQVGAMHHPQAAPAYDARQSYGGCDCRPRFGLQ